MQSAALLVAGLGCLAIHFWCVGRCGALDFATGRRDGLDLATDCGSNRGFYPRWSIPSLIAALTGAALLLAAVLSPAAAHDHNRPGLNGWYGTLASGKGPCCGGPSVDAKTLDGPDWDRDGEHYRVRIDGAWHDVPPDAVLPGPNLDGRTLVWPIGGWGGLTIRCFMPGVMG